MTKAADSSAPDSHDDNTKGRPEAGSPPSPEPTAVSGLFDWEDAEGGPVPLAPGPDETPATLPSEASLDPAQYEVPEFVKLTPGQVGGLCKEALEAYLFGQRTRWDAAGRFWDMRREAVDTQWCLTIRVSLGGALLLQAGMPLDRLPSAEGEHQLCDLVESMVEQVNAAQTALRAEQQALLKDRERQAEANEKAAKKQAKAEAEAAHDRNEVDERARDIQLEQATAEKQRAEKTPTEQGWTAPVGPQPPASSGRPDDENDGHRRHTPFGHRHDDDDDKRGKK